MALEVVGELPTLAVVAVGSYQEYIELGPRLLPVGECR